MRRIAAIALAVLGLFVFAAPVSAQQYPNRTVTIIVPYPAGGPTDQIARVRRQFRCRRSSKQNFIVENVSGGGTIIATNRVANATPDGYTLLLHNLQISANVTLYKNLPFDTEKDLTPIMFINKNPLVLVGRKTLDAEHAHRSDRPDEEGDAEGGDCRASAPPAISPPSLFAQEAKVQDRPHPVSRRGAGHDRPARRPCRSVLRHAAVGRAAGQSRQAEGLRHHREGKVAAASERRELRQACSDRSSRFCIGRPCSRRPERRRR